MEDKEIAEVIETAEDGYEEESLDNTTTQNDDSDDWDDIDFSDLVPEEISSDDGDLAEQNSAPEEEKPKPQTRRLKAKHLDEERDFDIDSDEGLAEVREYVQKGMDYDRIRKKHDDAVALHEDHEAFLKELAANSNQDVDAMIDHSRARLLMNEEAKKGNKLTEAEALRRVMENKGSRKAPSAEENEPKPSSKADDDKPYKEFVEDFPDVDPKTIPQEVWDEFARTGNLTRAYSRYERKRAKEENESLKNQKRNRERSTGSRQSTASKAPMSEFDAMWYDGT